MGRFRNPATGVTFSVDDSKDDRYGADFALSAEVEDVQYSSMKVAELRDEIARRNEGRDEADALPSDGNKGDLIAVLEADDEGQADSPDDEK